jgi:hypothetical protein
MAEQIEIEPITAAQTIPLRQAILWPHMPPSYVVLPEDDRGMHFGAFVKNSTNNRKRKKKD